MFSINIISIYKFIFALRVSQDVAPGTVYPGAIYAVYIMYNPTNNAV